MISGYSMGGFASYKLGLSYPDLFAKAMPLAGPPQCGVGAGVAGVDRPGRARPVHHRRKHHRPAGAQRPLGAVRHGRRPRRRAGAVPERAEPDREVPTQAGLRFHFETYPTEDHLVYATQDGFSSEVVADR